MQQHHLLVYDIARKTGTSIKKTRDIITEYLQLARGLIASGEKFNFPKIGILRLVRKGKDRRVMFRGKLITYKMKSNIKFSPNENLIKEINERGR